ncbi:MAG: serine/threonine protein kinase [Planctomycetota bacterium]
MSDSAIVAEMVEQWVEAQQAGRAVSPEDLCRTLPHLLAELKREIDSLGPSGLAGRGDLHPSASEDLLQSVSSLASLCFHAKGGLGAVYRATEKELNRQVAVKFIHQNLVRDPESRDRFLLEAEVTGRLEHPGIVPLYGVGQTAVGRLFYYMRYIDGETMDDAIQRYHQARSASGADSENSVEFRRLLAAFMSVCRTVAYAHNRGIVHRDIKPANVMLGRYGETIVVDWGLAIPVNREDRFRNSGELTLMPSSGSQAGSSSGGGAGTLAYMSPEQASGLAPTPASDVYSLGATLYKILCGEPAFTGDNGHEIRTRVIEGRFSKPSVIQRSTARSLEVICLKAMQSRPSDRYPTALDLALDIEHYLADEPIGVLPDSPAQKAGRWIRRHRFAAKVAAAGIAGVVLVSLLAAAWLGALARRESEARELADRSHLLAEQARKENLETTAKSMAQAVGYEIDLRWRLLESEAQSAELRRLMTLADADPLNRTLWEPIQAWLNEHRGLKGSAIQNSNWSVFSSHGLQYARTPRGSSIGNEYRHRDYFHGLGYDLDKDDPRVATLRPLQFLLPKVVELGDVVHLSCVYQSTATNKLVVSFSVPIWDHEDPVSRQILGLLAMTLEIDDFGVQKNAMLFQTAPDQITRQPGTVIAHPRLKDRKSDAPLPRVADQILRQAEALHEGDPRNAVSVAEDFVDPISGETHLAAMAPVIVQGRAREVADIGWVLLVTEAH